MMRNQMNVLDIANDDFPLHFTLKTIIKALKSVKWLMCQPNQVNLTATTIAAEDQL